uniref:Uncharacterized protein n=1 Tax=Rhodopseudomonas palustris (strain BisA53) TaxID=316055 RepID=Q07Q79_RHOP5
MSKTLSITTALFAVLSIAAIEPAMAQGRGYGYGPVGTVCARDIAAHCSGYSHGNRGVRMCLERRRSQLSGACKSALDNTGGGRGMGRFNR